MPYKTREDLPENVRGVLPAHAQEIYMEAFNNAWEQYKDPSERKGNAGHEETAHKVAWSAVKKSYHKDTGGKWQTR